MRRDPLFKHVPGITITLVMLFTLWLPVAGQYIVDQRYIDNLRQDIYVLASDSLEGREAGTAGDSLASSYIANRFTSISVAPYFEDGYFQPFSFSDRFYFPEELNNMWSHIPDIGSRRRDAITLTSASFTPFVWGNDGTATGKVVDAGFGLYGFLPPGDLSPRGKGRHSKKPTAIANQNLRGNIMLARYDVPRGYSGTAGNTGELMREKARYAKELGAVALILYDPAGAFIPPPSELMEGDQVYLPVIFMHDHEMANKLSGTNVTISLKAARKRSHTHNVVAHINNGAKQTVVIGAHYDHLGWGGSTSRDTSKAPAIHYGADDNASGVAGMLAVADWMASNNTLTSKNYIFIAFGAEEKGLIGARRFVEREEINSERVFAMLNLDMIGRLDDESQELRLLGAGSSPAWDELTAIPSTSMEVVSVRGGLSGSDHYYFYDEGIPVLFVHTGIHEDYHRSTDTPDKINFKGLANVVDYTIGLLHILDTLQTLPYERIETDEARGHRVTRQYSLGIVPGHGMDVTGVYVQEVSRGWIAEGVGLLRGDVIIHVGDTEVKSMYDYMHALSKITQGDQIEVVVLRNGKHKIFQFQF